MFGCGSVYTWLTLPQEEGGGGNSVIGCICIGLSCNEDTEKPFTTEPLPVLAKRSYEQRAERTMLSCWMQLGCCVVCQIGCMEKRRGRRLEQKVWQPVAFTCKSGDAYVWVSDSKKQSWAAAYRKEGCFNGIVVASTTTRGYNNGR